MQAAPVVLFICLVWPEPDSSAAGYRTLQLIQHFLSAGCKLVVSSAAKVNAYQANLVAIGCETVSYAANDPSFNSYIEALQPSIVVFDRFIIEEQFAWRVKKYSPQAVRILDTVDLHFLRKIRAEQVEGNHFTASFEIHQQTLPDFGLRELASILRSDICLLVSESEKNYLLKLLKIPLDSIFVLPWSYRLPSQISKQLAFTERENFVWIGNFQHAPNSDSLDFLLAKIWPRISQRLPSAKLDIYGAYMPESLKNNWRNLKLVSFLAKAEDAFITLSKYKIPNFPLNFSTRNIK